MTDLVVEASSPGVPSVAVSTPAGVNLTVSNSGPPGPPGPAGADGPPGPAGPAGPGLTPPAVITSTDPAAAPLTVVGTIDQNTSLLQLDGPRISLIRSRTPYLKLQQVGATYGSSDLTIGNEYSEPCFLFNNSGAAYGWVDVQLAAAQSANGYYATLKYRNSANEPANTAALGYGELSLQTAGSEALLVGRYGSGFSGRLSIGSTSGGSYGGGVGPMLFLANDTSDPSTNPVGGGILFVSNGALKYRGSSGTVTTIAPA